MPCPVISLLPKWDRNKSRIVTQLGHPTPDIQSSTTRARSQVANPRDLSAQPTDNTNHRAVRHSNGAALSPDLRERLRAHQRIRGERRSPSRRRPGRARPRRPRRRAPPARPRTHRRSSASQHPPLPPPASSPRRHPGDEPAAPPPPPRAAARRSPPSAAAAAGGGPGGGGRCGGGSGGSAAEASHTGVWGDVAATARACEDDTAEAII